MHVNTIINLVDLDFGHEMKTHILGYIYIVFLIYLYFYPYLVLS